jgi:arylsulfatase A-like enzyme
MLHPERGEPSLLKILRDNGYFVWWGGKNDLVPGQDGYDAYSDVKFRVHDEHLERWGLSLQEPHHGGAKEWRGAPDGDNYYSFYRGRLDKGDEDIYCDYDWSMVLGAIDFVKEYDGGKPLFVYLPLGFPHPPYQVEEPYYSAIDPAKVPPRVPTPESWEGRPSLLKGIWDRLNMKGWTEERWAELRRTYYGMCARVDDQFGRVLDAFREAGIYDDAAIFMFSDHGDFTGDYGLVEKTQNTFEDCLSRVPFLAKPPKDRPVKPRVSEAMVELLDFPATVYELTGIEPGYSHFGRSLLPVLAGETDEVRDAVFCEGGRLLGERHCMEVESTSSQTPEGLYWPRVGLQSEEDPPYHTKAAMCRTKDFKYVRRHYESDELYDLTEDPQETRNVIGNPEYADVLAGMKERMLRWYMETCDVVPFETDKRGW